MYTFEYDFFPDSSKVSNVDYIDFDNGVLTSFLVALFRNGQLADQYWNILEVNNHLRCYCLAIEKDSLESKYYNEYCQKRLEELLEKSTRPPEFKAIGESISLSKACSCVNPSFYILYTNFERDSPPVSCGDCNLPVPLYKLPKINDEGEYSTLITWDWMYQACDTLFMLSFIGEKFGYRQTANVSSGLTKDGLNICKKMSEKTGKPFYYYLRKYYSSPKKHVQIVGIVGS